MYFLSSLFSGMSATATTTDSTTVPTNAATISLTSLFKRYGWKPDRPDFRDHYHASAVMNLAKTVDLRSGMPPIYDQGQCGSCTAQAISAAIEFDESKQGLPSFNPSRLFIYYNERKQEGTVDTDTGASLRDGIKAISREGYCSETMWPYDIKKFATCPPQTCYDSALSHRAVNYKRVPQSLLQLQDVLTNGYPVVCGISVYESFESAETVRTGKVPYPEKTEQMLGGHGIILCGYNNAQRTFTFRNSWGTSFGDSGYGYIPFNYILNPDLAQDFWVVTRVIAPTKTDTNTDTTSHDTVVATDSAVNSIAPSTTALVSALPTITVSTAASTAASTAVSTAASTETNTQ